MKKLLLTGCSSLLLMACSQMNSKDKIELGKNYGPEKVDTTASLTVTEMVSKFEKNPIETSFTIKTPIVEICQTAGCWVSIDKGNGETIRVRFKDHFTIPTKTKIGTETYIHGIAYMDTVPVELLQHFAEDAGKSEVEIKKITQPKFELCFEADGITLVK